MNPNDLAEAARAALERTVDTKVNAVRDLVERSVAADDAEQRAVAARAALDAAWTAALSTGWTDKELRQLGLSAPAQTAARPRSRRKSAAVAGSRDDS